MTMVTYANFIQNNIYLCLECLQTLINPKQHSMNKIKIKRKNKNNQKWEWSFWTKLA